jgi:hypothetical protein
MFNFDLPDGFYALGINLAHRNYFTVNTRRKLYRLAGIPMRCSPSLVDFCKLTFTFVNFLRASYPELLCPVPGNGIKTYLRRTR